MIDPATKPDRAIKRVSLRIKLTLWMLAIFLLVQLSLALVFELYQNRSISSFFNSRIALRIEPIAALIASQLHEPGVDDQALRFHASTQKLLPLDQFVIDLHDAEGRLIASSRRPGVPISSEIFAQAGTAHDTVFTTLPIGSITLDQGDQVPGRTAIVPINDDKGRRYFVVAAISDVQAQEMLLLVSRVILVCIPIGLIATGVSAYVIAGIAVRPLTAIRAVARQLSPESIGRHLQVPAAPASEEVAAVERELELARQRIEAGFAAQERFMSNVSHELKTPIATILTEVQVLQPERAPGPIRDFLKSVTEELEKLARSVDSFLLLTRVRHGKTQIPAAQTCLIRDVLLESYASCIAMANQHRVRIELMLPEGEDADAAVIGNCDLLRIIFDNIIRNAIRFSPASSVITIRAECQGNDLHVFVRDRGPGIPPDLLPRIFDRFAQSKDEERRGRGHGLGLEIALGVAELHSGSIAVRNCDDSGCEFAIRLPLFRTSPANQPEPAPPSTCAAPRISGDSPSQPTRRDA